METHVEEVEQWLAAIWAAASPRQRALWRRREGGVDPLRSAAHGILETVISERERARGRTVSPWEAGIIDLGVSSGVRTKLVRFNLWKRPQIRAADVAQLHRACVAFDADAGVIYGAGRFTEEARYLAPVLGIELVGGEELLRVIDTWAQLALPLEVSAAA